jgi:hypothetical protein
MRNREEECMAFGQSFFKTSSRIISNCFSIFFSKWDILKLNRKDPNSLHGMSTLTDIFPKWRCDVSSGKQHADVIFFHNVPCLRYSLST